MLIKMEISQQKSAGILQRIKKIIADYMPSTLYTP